MTRMATRVCLVLALLIGASRSGRADLLALNQSGAFGPTSTLDGAAFGADTAFSYRAVFDTTSADVQDPGLVFVPITLTIEIDGHGVFTSSAAADLRVYLGDPSTAGVYFAGIVNAARDAGVFAAYSDAAPPFFATSPTPTTFSGLLGVLHGFPFTIELAGGAGPLVINDLGDAPFPSSISAVPEPSSLALVGLGLAGTLVVARRRMRAA